MLRWFGSRIFWGIALICGGILFLLQNLLGFEFGAVFWAALFGIASVGFLMIFFQQRTNWWALIPGITLASVSVLIFISTFFPGFGDQLGGFLILGGIGAAFVVVYLVDRANWWAIIPAGVLLTLASITILSNMAAGEAVAGVFFLGLGATFGLVALLPSQAGNMRWAFIPAGILGFMGLLMLAFADGMLAFIVPVVLILVGLIFILRTMLAR